MFDPYRDWLGIAAAHRPLDHYSLLGLQLFESHPQVIAAAADRQYQRVMQLRGTEHAIWVTPLVQELTAARGCLLSPEKQTYDQALYRLLHPAPLPDLESAAVPVETWLPPTAPKMAAPAQSAQPPLPPPVPKNPTTAEPEELESARQSFSWTLKILLGSAVTLILCVAGWFLGQWAARPATVAEEPLVESERYEGPDQNPQDAPPAEDEPAVPVKPPAVQPLVTVQQEGNGEFQFTPSTAQLTGGVELISLGTESVLGNWTTISDRITWQFRVVKPDVFKLQITYAAIDEWAGGRFEVAVDGDGKQHVTRASGSREAFVTDEFFVPITKGGKHELTLRMLESSGDELMILQRIRLVPTRQRGS